MCKVEGGECVSCDPATRVRKPTCQHERLERHFDVPSDEFSLPERKTEPLEVTTATISVEVADSDSLASFFELMARLLRTRGKVRVRVDGGR